MQEKQLVLKTDTESVRIYLGPTAFLTERKLEIRKGDTLAVTGSRVAVNALWGLLDMTPEGRGQFMPKLVY